MLDQTFDAYYFANCCGVPYKRDDHWLTFFGRIADHIVAGIQPRTVLDAGCALGILVEGLRDRGVDASGIDISSYAIENVYEPIRPFCREGSIADEFSERYDLIVSIEVLEHMPARDGENTIANFCRHTDDVLFSSTPHDHRELSHVNVQPSEYWAELFARNGFFRDVDFDATFLTPWAVRYRRSREPLPRIVRHYERAYTLLAESRNDARTYSTELQRNLAQAQAQLSEGEAERRAGAQARADLQFAIEQQSQLARTSDQERAALQLRLHTATAAGQTLNTQLQAAIDGHAALERQLSDARALNEALHESVEQGHSNLNRKIVALEAAERRVAELKAHTDALGHEVEFGRQTIALMERSLFWRMRKVWVAIARVFGRST